jgi:hypothetical protein
MLLDAFLLAPLMAIFAALWWHTRRDIYAVLPGFGVGFFIGVVFSSGVGLAATIYCGLFLSSIGASLNALCRGFWRFGIAALIGILAYLAIVSGICFFLGK